MNTRSQFQVALIAVVASFGFHANLPAVHAQGGEQHSTVLPHIGDNVVAVAYADLSAVSLPAWIAEAGRYGVPQEILKETAAGAGQLQQLFDQLKALGARRAYVLISASDVAHRGCAVVLETAPGERPNRLVTFITGMLGANSLSGSGQPTQFTPTRVAASDSAVLLAVNDQQMDQLRQAATAAPRADVRAALEALGDADAGLVIFGDSDSRRVVREMFPALPAPFMEIDGRLIADDLRWGGVKLNQPPELQATVIVEAVDDDAARTVEQSAVKGIELGKGAALAATAKNAGELPIDPVQLVEGLSLLKPELAGSRLTLTLGDDEEELAFVRDLLTPAVNAARQSTTRSQRMNAFKMLGLAMHNYENSNVVEQDGKLIRTFPAHANYDDDGQPLLSWRVHILPYLEEQALYDQFHLDEPWDSKHNLKLVERMPEVYADPDPILRAKIGAGRTTYVVPYGDGAMFFGKEGVALRDITDGTSNTILTVEVIPERAVIWTKPDDWGVNLDHPLTGVQRTDREGFVAGRCDGSVEFIANAIDAKVFRAMLTKAGED